MAACHFPDHILKWIFVNENVWILIKTSLKFASRGSQYSNISSDNAWCQPGNKPLSEPMMVSLLMHVCVTQRKWVKPFTNFMYKF